MVNDLKVIIRKGGIKTIAVVKSDYYFYPYNGQICKTKGTHFINKISLVKRTPRKLKKFYKNDKTRIKGVYKFV